MYCSSAPRESPPPPDDQDVMTLWDAVCLSAAAAVPKATVKPQGRVLRSPPHPLPRVRKRRCAAAPALRHRICWPPAAPPPSPDPSIRRIVGSPVEGPSDEVVVWMSTWYVQQPILVTGPGRRGGGSCTATRCAGVWVGRDPPGGSCGVRQRPNGVRVVLCVDWPPGAKWGLWEERDCVVVCVQEGVCVRVCTRGGGGTRWQGSAALGTPLPLRDPIALVSDHRPNQTCR